MERVKSSDVLDATHLTVRPFRGRELGEFRRLGPNPWDDYQFVKVVCSSDSTNTEDAGSEASEAVEVLPQIPVQLEARGVEVRCRSKGRVARLRWLPNPEDLEQLGSHPEPRQVRRYFVERFLSPLDSAGGIGAGAVIVKKIVST